MSTKQNSLEVTIMGRAYKFACVESERADLLAAASYLDGKMNEIKSAGKVASAERIAVMAALNITNEMLGITKAPSSPDVDLDGYRRRIAAMRAMLDQTLEPQEKLL